jgi:hypothetical protein
VCQDWPVALATGGCEPRPPGATLGGPACVGSVLVCPAREEPAMTETTTSSHPPTDPAAATQDPTIRTRTRRGRGGREVQTGRLRLLAGDGHPAPDDRLCPAGLARRPGRRAAGPRHRQLRQDLGRLRRRPTRRPAPPRPHRRQPQPVLADRHRRLGRPVLLGGRPSAGPSAGQRPAASSGHGAGRLHHLPGELWAAPAAGSRPSTPTSPTATRPSGAATSPPGKNPSCSPKNSAPPSKPRGSRSEGTGVGHHLPQKAPQAFTETGLNVDGY